MKILIVRNDKLGDFVLTLPCYQLLKTCLPQAHISVLVPEYTADIARHCPYIDDVIIDTQVYSLAGLSPLVQQLRQQQFDSVITLFSSTFTGVAVWLSGIPYRMAPATKLAQIFYNRRIKQRRSRSEKPEYVYNLDLITTFLSQHGILEIPQPKAPYLSFIKEDVAARHSDFYQKHRLNPQQKPVFLHAGSGGSANSLSLPQFAELARGLAGKQTDPEQQIVFVLTAGPGERQQAEQLSAQIADLPHVIYESTDGLIAFAQHIAFAQVFISGSTGTLHIAGALNVPTAGFYTRRQSATPLRWQTLNTPERRLAFTPPPDAEETEMQKIDVVGAAARIYQAFLA